MFLDGFERICSGGGVALHEATMLKAGGGRVRRSRPRARERLRAYDLEHLLVKVTVRRNDVSSIRREGRPVKAGDTPAGFLDQQQARGHIPWLQVLLPEPVHPSCRDVAEIQCRRAQPSHGTGASQKAPEEAYDVIRPRLDVVGKPSDEQRIDQGRRLRHAQRRAVQKCPSLPLCRNSS